MPKEKVAFLCPACKNGILKKHCPEANRHCRWLKCKERRCQFVADPEKGKGWRTENDVKGVPQTVFYKLAR